jgi:WD40 repeat protein
LGISPTGRGFATIEHSIARIRIWEFRGQIVFKHKTAIPPPAGIRTGSCLAISPSANWVAAGLESTSGQGMLARSELDVRHPNTTSWPAHAGTILGVAFLPDGQSLLSAATDGLLKHWSLTGELLRTIDWQIGELGAVAIAPDGLTAAVGGAEDIVIWDLEL